jgi:hypothetical protein
MSHLRVAVPGEGTGSPVAARRTIARVMRAIAEVCDTDAAYTIEGHDRGPVCAALVVLFDAEGEPVPVSLGIEGENWTDDARWMELVQDANRAIHDLRPMRFVFAGVESEPEDIHEGIRRRWLATVDGRRRLAAERAAKAERTERERPFLCDCGFRAKTQGGLTNHLNRSRRHRTFGSSR